MISGYNSVVSKIMKHLIHSEAKLLKLKYRREQHTLNFMYGKSGCRDSLRELNGTGVVTRSQRKKVMKTKKPKTEKLKKSLAYRGPKEWNDLPIEFHHTQERNLFKKMVGDRMIMKALSAT